jgi:hypothetical protein
MSARCSVAVAKDILRRRHSERFHERPRRSSIILQYLCDHLQGGFYVAPVVATFGGGSVKLQTLGPDGSTTYQLTAQPVISARAVRQLCSTAAGAVQIYDRDRDWRLLLCVRRA